MTNKNSTIVNKLNLTDLSEEKKNSIKMILNKLIRSDMNLAVELLLFMCEKDVFYSYEIVNGIKNDELRNAFLEFVREHSETLFKTGKIQYVNTIVVTQERRCFEFVFEQVIQNPKKYYKKNGASGFIVSFHKFMLENAKKKEDLYTLDEKFEHYFSVYDNNYDKDLKHIIEFSVENMIYKGLNRIIAVIGGTGLSEIMGEGAFIELVKGLLIIEKGNDTVWHRYLDFVLEKELDTDTRLIDIDWFVPMYADNNPDPYVYTIWKNYDKEKKETYYSKIWDVPRDFWLISEETKQLARSVISEECENDIDNIVQFIDNNSNSNPFYWNDDEVAQTIIEQNNFGGLYHFESKIASYSRLRMMFQNSVSLNKILLLYFHTFFCFEICIEDLVSLVKEFNLVDEWTRVIGKEEFYGYIYRKNGTTVDILPLNYIGINRHHLYLKEDSLYLKDTKCTCIKYRISQIVKNHVSIVPIEMNQATSEITTDEKWAECIRILRELLQEGNEDIKKINQYKDVLKEVSDFGVYEFESNLDFGKLINVLVENEATPNVAAGFLKYMMWNYNFLEKSKVPIDPKIFVLFNQYEEATLGYLKKCMQQSEDEEVSIKRIFKLYFSSIFKVIVSLDRLIELFESNDKVNDYLKSQLFECRLWKKLEPFRCLCRVSSCKCAPIALLYYDGNSNVDSGKTVKTKITEISRSYDNSVRQIIFEQCIDSVICSEREMRYAFSVIGKYASSNYGKLRKFPDIDDYIDAIPEAIVGGFCQGLYNRRFSILSMNRLIYKLHYGNPFRYTEKGVRAICYYGIFNLDAFAEVTLQSLILNSKSATDIIHIYMNSHLKWVCAVDELYSLIDNKNRGLLESIDSELSRYDFYGIIKDGKLITPYLSNLLSVSLDDGIYSFKLTTLGEIQTYQIKKLNLDRSYDNLLWQVITLLKHKYPVDSIWELKEILDSGYSGFCKVFHFKCENNNIFQLYKKIGGTEPEYDFEEFEKEYAPLIKYEHNSGSFISAFADIAKEIISKSGTDAGIKFMDMCINRIQKMGFFMRDNEYSLIMQAVCICEEIRDSQETVRYLRTAYLVKQGGAAKKKLTSYGMEV